MSFWYNTRLPYFFWGLGSSGTGWNFVDSYAHLNIPLPENGENKSWNAQRIAPPSAFPSIASTAPFSGPPCDAQMPWKKLAFIDGFCVGLTIHGEVYFIPAINADNGGQSLRRVQRWKSANVQMPIKDIFLVQNYDNMTDLSSASIQSRLNAFAIGVDTEGKAWWLHRDPFFASFRDRTTLARSQNAATEFPMPEGESLIYADVFYSFNISIRPWSLSYIYVVSTDASKTYLRQAGSNTWLLLTSACVGADIDDDLSAYWDGNNLPTAIVDDPESEDGVKSQVRILWEADPFFGAARTRISGVIITTPGRGYASSPQVTFSRPPDNGTAPNISLRVFDDYIVSKSRGGNDGNFALCYVTAKGTTTHINFDPSWMYDNSRPSFLGSDGIDWNWMKETIYDEPVQQFAQRLGFNYSSDQTSVQRLYYIGKNKKLYVSRDAVGDPLQWDVLDDGPWRSIAGFVTNQNTGVLAAVKETGALYTWGINGRSTFFGDNLINPFESALFGDESPLGEERQTPTQVAESAEWLSVVAGPAMFAAIRKDAICREIDQPMEYFPDWHYQTQT